MPVTNYYSVNGQVVGEQPVGNPSARLDYLTDALGSVTATVNQSAQVENTYRYKPCGVRLAKTGAGSDPAFQWVGSWGYRQTSKSYADTYVRARHYSSATARWISRDPIGYGDGMNLFAYAGNNPVLLKDPSGYISFVLEYTNPPERKFLGCNPPGQSPRAVWEIRFNKFPECEGFLVQHVARAHETKKNCDNTSPAEKEPLYEYWEAVYIPKNGARKNKYTDWFTLPVPGEAGQRPLQQGLKAQVGIMKFFCMKTTKDLRKRWKDKVPDAKGLPATYKLTPEERDWWKRESDEDVGTGLHIATMQYCCCPPVEYLLFDVLPGR